VSLGVAVKKKELAQSAVEFALALPFLTWVLLGTVDFARVYYLQSAVTNAARTGAQFALESRQEPDAVRMIVKAEAAPLIEIDNGDIAFTATPSWAPGNHLKVEVVQRFYALTPFVNRLWGSGPLVVKGTSIVRFNP